jgi:hypothetical protein
MGHLMDANEPPKNSKKARWASASPFLLLAFGAVLSWYLGPHLAQNWQDRQAALDNKRAQLELKVKLLRQVAILTVGEVGFIDDKFSSQLGLNVGVTTHLRAVTRRVWIQGDADVDGELRAWFPDAQSGVKSKSSKLAAEWAALENRMLEFEGQQATLRVLPQSANAKTTVGNAKVLVAQQELLVQMRKERLADQDYGRKNPGLETLWDKLKNAPPAPNPAQVIPGSIGSEAIKVEEAIHSIAIAEFNDARARLARRLLASDALGFRTAGS